MCIHAEMKQCDGQCIECPWRYVVEDYVTGRRLGSYRTVAGAHQAADDARSAGASSVVRDLRVLRPAKQ